MMIKLVIKICAMLLLIASGSNAFDFFGFTNNKESKFFSAYESALPNEEKKNAATQEKIFTEAYNLFLENYIYEYDDKKQEDLINKAIEILLQEVQKIKSENKTITAYDLMANTMSSLFNSIDAHTLYMPTKKANDFSSHLSGKYKGIGVMFNFDKNKNLMQIIKVFPDSPAKKAGVRTNDYIYAVDGREISLEDKLEDVINSIKGQEGTTVKLKLQRDKDFLEVLVTRGDYYVPSVDWKIYDNKYAYIAIHTFNQDTATLFRNALFAVNLNSLEGLIIDVRNNPGGLLPAVVLISDTMLSGEKIVSIKGRNASNNKTFLSINKILVDDNIPIVVLTNAFSASASELLSGALAINNRATLIGDSTFGKWSVQSSYTLKDKSIFNITTQLFYGPKNATFQGIGIAPDIQIATDKKPFREKDYSNYLKTDDVNNVVRKPKLTVEENKCPSTYENNDYVLGCAILYLKSNANLNNFMGQINGN